MSPILGFQIPSSLSSVLDAPFGKVGFYLSHLVCGLRLTSSSFFLEVFRFYKVHLVQLFPNAISKVLTFEVFCVAHEIPLDVTLFCYFYRLKRYGDWHSFSSRHFPPPPLSPNISCSNANWKIRFCWVGVHNLCFPITPCYVPLGDDLVSLFDDLLSFRTLVFPFLRKKFVLIRSCTYFVSYDPLLESSMSTSNVIYVSYKFV